MKQFKNGKVWDQLTRSAQKGRSTVRNKNSHHFLLNITMEYDYEACKRHDRLGHSFACE